MKYFFQACVVIGQLLSFLFLSFLLRLPCTFYDACFVRLGNNKATGCPGVSTSRLSVGWSVLFPGLFQFQYHAGGTYIQRLTTL